MLGRARSQMGFDNQDPASRRRRNRSLPAKASNGADPHLKLIYYENLMNLDIKEKGGLRNGQQQVSERRLFMQLLAFGDCREPCALGHALDAAHLPAVLYQDVNDTRGIGLLTWH